MMDTVLSLLIRDLKEHVTSWQHVLCLEVIKCVLLESPNTLIELISVKEASVQEIDEYGCAISDLLKTILIFCERALPVGCVVTGDFTKNRLK